MEATLKAKLISDKKLLKVRNVVGTAVGEKFTNGLPTGKPAILVFVEKKLSTRGILSKFSSSDIIPDNIDGIKTDVIEVGKLVKQSGYKSKIRPIKPGYSCGHKSITAGTIGGLFVDGDGDTIILSNNHVLACFDELTEVLTIDGWKKWDNVTPYDQLATLNTTTNELEYQYPSVLHKYFYNGELIRFQSKHIDQVVTPNHRLYCRNDYRNSTKKSQWGFQQADQVIVSGNNTIRFTRSANWHCATVDKVKEDIESCGGPSITNMGVWVEFLGMFLLEGSTTYSPEYYNKYGKRKRGEEFITQIRNLDNEFLEDCKRLLDILGFHSFINYKSHYCRSYDKTLYEYLKRFGKSENKFIPTEIKQLQRQYLNILLLSLSRGDGCQYGHKLTNHTFTLKSKRLIDDIQEIAIKLGGCATVKPQNGSTFCPNGKYWRCEVFWTNLEPKVRSISKIEYDGMVYCATVPNGTLLVRRNGKPCWSGNCENNAKAGDIIYQPGPYDYRGDKEFKGWSNPSDIPYFATLKKFVKIQANNNTQDSAIAIVNKAFLDAGMVLTSYPDIGKPLAGWEDVKVGESVQKCGRTTGYTTGRVLGLHATFTISYDMGAIKFTDCIVLTPMSDGGDSVGADTMLYYRVNGQLRYSSIAEMYDQLSVQSWLDNERFIPADYVEVLSTTDTKIYKRGKQKSETKCYWAKVNWLYKHLTDKKLFKIWTRDHREITITSDHSLFGSNNLHPYSNFPAISGSQIGIGTQLLVPSTLQAVGDGINIGLSNDFLTIIGLFLGDGSLERNNTRVNISSGGNLAISKFIQQHILSNDEYLTPSDLARKEYQSNHKFNRRSFARIHNISQSAVQHATMTPYTSKQICYIKKNGDITISNVRFARKLTKLGFHSGFATKSIPQWLMAATITEIKALLRGLFSSDGGIKFRKNNQPILSFGVHNKTLAEQCRILLWRCGIECGLSHENTTHAGFNATCPKAFRVTIAGINSIKQFIEEIGLIGHDNRITRAKQELCKYSNRKHYMLTSKTVKGIEEQFIQQPVYDLSVEGERFIANGFVCHNSGSIISDLDMNAIGLLFAGSQKVTIANPIIPIRDHYKLSIWNGTNKPNTLIDGFTLVVHHGKATYTNGVLAIEDSANHSCYLEKQLQSFDCISCTINTGTDQGQTWGPGISIIWPNGYIETNLRYNGTFGAYYAGQSILNIGKTKPNYDYKVKFIKENNRLKGQIYDNSTWVTVIEVSDSVIKTPITVRIGKTDMCGGSGDYQNAGPIGQCSIRDIKIT